MLGATMKDTKTVREAKVSLAEMLEQLKPFLPKVNLAEPEPARKWRLAKQAQDQCTEPCLKHEHEPK